MAECKVLFHIDELGKWSLLLSNISNLINAEDGNFNIMAVANSEAVKYYDTAKKLSADLETVKALSSRGVRFIACSNSLNAYSIDKSNMPPFIDIVPSGVAEIAIRQGEGYAYIKP